MLRIIDTNYALRYLVQDDIKLAKEAQEIINMGAYILPESLVEIVHVLMKGYNVDRKETYFAILDLLGDVEIFDKPLYEEAIRLFGRTKLDFVDCILITRSRMMNDKIYSFDKDLNKELNKDSLSPA